MEMACMVSLVIVLFSFATMLKRFSQCLAIHERQPGRFVLHLAFNHFQTIGMRRLVGEGFKSRFVTGERLEAMLKVRVSNALDCFHDSPYLCSVFRRT
jgi:hypothetical protein